MKMDALRETLEHVSRELHWVVEDLERHAQYCEPQYGKYGQLNCDACDALREIVPLLDKIEDTLGGAKQ